MYTTYVSPFYFAILQFFWFLVLLLYNDAYFEHAERYEKDDYQRPQIIQYLKTVIDDFDFLKKAVIIQ